MSNLDEFRREKDQFFAESHHSPLSFEQKEHFDGLEYFPENPDLRMELELERFNEIDEITMQTSTGDVQVYRRMGKVSFEVEGKEAALTIFNNAHGYFMPFVDSLAGEDTYPAGRYLEPVPLEGGKIGIDFNLAYNPYCAYNEMWSCPFPPAENRLHVPIRAGEKIFEKSEVQEKS